MKNSVLVSGLPPGINEDKLEIYFQKKKNGGGDVATVRLLDNGTKAVVEFDEEKSVDTVLQKSHIIQGKVIKVEKHVPSRRNALFIKSESTINPHVLSQSGISSTELSQLAETFENVNIEKQGGKYVVISDSLAKLREFEKKFKKISKRQNHAFSQSERRTKPSAPKTDRSQIRKQPESLDDANPSTSSQNKNENHSERENRSLVKPSVTPQGFSSSQSDPLTPEWSDSPFPQPKNGSTFVETVSVSGRTVVRRKFCFPSGDIALTGDAIRYPAYDCNVTLPNTTLGQILSASLEEAFNKRKLFYIAKNKLGKGFIIQSAYDMFGRSADVDLSKPEKMAEVKSRLNDLGIAVNVVKNAPNVHRPPPIVHRQEPMDTSPPEPAKPQKIGPFPQPDGLSASSEFHPKDLGGFSNSGAIHTYFRFPGGSVTTEDGQVIKYLSYNRTACLPGTTEGRKLHAMLLEAAYRKKLFVIAQKDGVYMIRTKARLLTSDDYPVIGEYLEELQQALLKLGIQRLKLPPPLPERREDHYEEASEDEDSTKETKWGPFPQPDNGVMRTEKEDNSPNNGGMIKIYFRFAGGKMKIEGSKPSKSFEVQYTQVNTVAALPNTDSGRRLAIMIQTAFDEKKLFYIQKKTGEPSFRIRPHVKFSTSDECTKPSYLQNLKKELNNLGLNEPNDRAVASFNIPKSSTPQGGALTSKWTETSTNIPVVLPRPAPNFSNSGAVRKAPRRSSPFERVYFPPPSPTKRKGYKQQRSHGFGPNDSFMKEEEKCGICLEPLSGTRMKKLPCNHTFHPSCIEMALKHKNKCPCCSEDAGEPLPTPGVPSDPSEDKEKCAVCLGPLEEQPTKKLSCGHVFHQTCIDMALKEYKKCPYCNQPVNGGSLPNAVPSRARTPSPINGGAYGFSLMREFGVTTQYTPPMVGQFGNQPSDGFMTDHTESQPLPGYPGCGTIVILYHIPGGIQQSSHPNPGFPYASTQREAYLPDTLEGRDLLKLLRRAFDAGLTFTVGRSQSSGLDNQIIWNEIPHKTNREGGRHCYGYPDPKYLFELREALANLGIQ